MDIQPEFKIGDVVNIADHYDFIQTNYGYNRVFLYSKIGGEPVDYYIHDVKIEIKLRTGEIHYSYLIGYNKKFEEYSEGGWVDGDSIKLKNIHKSVDKR